MSQILKGRMYWIKGTRYIHIIIHKINNKNLKKTVDICLCLTDSLCRTPETNTTL